MPDVSSHWSELLSPALSEAFYIGFADRPASTIPLLYGVRSSQRADEQHLGVGVLGSQGWQFDGVNGSGRVEYDDRNKGYPKTFTHVQFAKGFMVERKLIDDNQSEIALDDARALGDSAFRKREKSGASVFANAFTSTTNEDGFSTLGPDGVVLCSDSHPYSADASGSTQDNAGTTALSATSVAATRVAMMKYTDDRGDLMNVMPDTLLIPPDLEDTAATITRSILDPTSGNNAVNPQSGRFQTIVWHYLTDTNNWFMIDRQRMKQSLLWYDRVALEFGRETDFDTFTAKFRAYMRFSYGWRDWAWVYGHAVT
jgi:hypothetical protein